MNKRILSIGVLTAVLAACSATPERNTLLEQAGAHLQSAKQDPQVGSLAPEELKRATDAMSLASQALARGDKVADVEHLAYVADQRVTIAQETARSRSAQAVVASASTERDRLRLALRTQEADATAGKLAQSEQANAQQSGQLAQAKVNAERGNARIGELEQQLSNMGAKKTDHGMVVTLGGVLFYTGQAKLLPHASQDIQKLAEFFKRNPKRSATIEGNTDSMGGDSANRDLAQRRADAVMMALINLGVPSANLRTIAKGEDNPVATNDTAAGRQMNRRVEVIFAPEPQALTIE